MSTLIWLLDTSHLLGLRHGASPAWQELLPGQPLLFDTAFCSAPLDGALENELSRDHDGNPLVHKLWFSWKHLIAPHSSTPH